MTKALVHRDATCIICGCTDDHACSENGDPCEWAFVSRTQHVGVCTKCFYAARHTPDFTAAPIPEEKPDDA